MIFNMAGGGGTGGTLTVAGPIGATTTVTKENKIKTKSIGSDGVVVFKGLTTGTWTLTITDGEQTSTKPVVITTDYNTVIAFFAATISITYPAGSTCTCSDGTTTFNAPDTSGIWECIVPNIGTWTLSCTDGVETTEDTVTITSDGQSETIELSYTYYLFNYGDVTKITGGFVCENKTAISGTNAGTPTITTNADGSWTIDAASMEGGIVRTVNKINTSEFTKLRFKGSIGEQNNYCKLVIWKDVSSTGYSGVVASVDKAVDGYAEIDVSSLNDGPYYIGFSIYHNFGNITMEQMWLE